MLCDYLELKDVVKVDGEIFNRWNELSHKSGGRDYYSESVDLNTYEVKQYFWDESHHNGDHYNELRLTQPLTGDALDKFQGILEKMALAKSNKEEEEKAKLEKERKDWDILTRKLVGMS